jgi:hypothetical protein
VGLTTSLVTGLSTLNQILSAGIAITAFSLLLYALTFNLRDRVARSFTLILACVVVVFTAEAIGSTLTELQAVEFWLRLQWVGILFLPPSYLHFSDAVLSTTGRPSRGKRRWVVRLTYILSVLILAASPFINFLGPVSVNSGPSPHLTPTPWMELFTLYYGLAMVAAWINFARAYLRTITPTTRRRMIYLMAGATAPALGSYPYLLFGSDFAARHQLLFWSMAFLSNLVIGGLLIIMAYAVAFFGVSWPDRVVKSRLFKWIMRGPVTASVVLAVVTVVRRLGALFGTPYSAMVPILMVGTILLLEYTITLFAPLWERYLFHGGDREDLAILRTLEDRLLSSRDLRQFMEMLLAAVCDRLQTPNAFVASWHGDHLEMVFMTGENKPLEDQQASEELVQMVIRNGLSGDLFVWGEYYLLPLLDEESEEGEDHLLGLLGVARRADESLDEEQLEALSVLAQRATLALLDRRRQQQIFRRMQTLTPQMELVQRIRAAAQYNGSVMLSKDSPLPQQDLAQWVKDALTHYWGGPKLTTSPLLQLKVVQNAVNDHEGNGANALRAILRDAIERIRPEGERRFTAEWILYNILEMKFMEGRKVREIALRLAMSEADLYRKQRVAIEAVAKIIQEMEEQARLKTVMVEGTPVNGSGSASLPMER